jgi:hypothetical protein
MFEAKSRGESDDAVKRAGELLPGEQSEAVSRSEYRSFQDYDGNADPSRLTKRQEWYQSGTTS